MQDLDIFDCLLTPIYVLLILFIAYYIKRRYIQTQDEYRYFIPGLIVKMIGAIALGLVYYYYYKGGDTINYYQTAVSYVNLAPTNFDRFLEGWLGSPMRVNMEQCFNESTGYPVYSHKDQNSFFVVRLLIPIMAFSFKSYFTCAILTATITYTGIWKLYQTFLQEFPELKKQLAIAILFVPSCVFWGSGLMKDSFTLSAVGWFTYSFYFFFIKKQWKTVFIVQFLISSFVILSIKPYIFFALLPGSIFWLSNQQIKKIQNSTLRMIAAPLLLLAGCTGGYFALYQMGDSLGLYKVDTVLERAVTVQKDMKADYYGGKTFDIGSFDSDIGSIIAKSPSAIFAGIFRPGIWDVRNAVMLVSSLENTYLLILTVFLLIRLRVIGFFGLIRINPMLLFAMMFSLFFAFSVGLTVANFGSLVRLRIPELPFFVAGLFILRHLYEKKSGVRLRF